ncbi:hypothetical protein PISMIDRAFT_678734 [Pisolithus microcarpus 441]|uniref:Uncharacterized protein n=1 Tax=Pisolithus microcarpus 441 TaxID=765257 RepID=A0A0C9ZNV8_9AGAM|nr:hypothetical protein PISMIDRAFT_678734 [Pisolithus microcarpus 441]
MGIGVQAFILHPANVWRGVESVVCAMTRSYRSRWFNPVDFAVFIHEIHASNRIFPSSQLTFFLDLLPGI